MRSLYKLILLEIIPPMLISLLIFVFVFLMRTIAKLAKMMIENQYSISEIGELLVYNIPWILGFVIPMSLLLGVILGLNRLSADSEIISILSSGLSPHTIMRPIFTLAVIMMFLNTWILMELVPWANNRADQIIQRHTSEVINSEINPRIFNENFPGYTIFVDNIDTSGQWNTVFLFNERDNEADKTVILAQRARLIQSDANGSLDLRIMDYHSYTIPATDIEDPKPASRGSFSTIKLVEAEEVESRATKAKNVRAKRIDELLADIEEKEDKLELQFTARNDSNSDRRLYVEIASGDAQPTEKEVLITPTRGVDTRYEVSLSMPDGYENLPIRLTLKADDRQLYTAETHVDQFDNNKTDLLLTNLVQAGSGLELFNIKTVRQKTVAEWIETHKKFALPFTCLVFAFLGLPLGISSRRGGKAYGYIVGIVIFIFYWALMSFSEILATNEVLSPEAGVWMPSVFFGVIALLLFMRKRMQIRIPVISRMLMRVRSNQDYLSETLEKDEQEAGKSDDQEGNRSATLRMRRQNEAKMLDRLKSGRQRLVGLVDTYVIRTFLNAFMLVFFTIYVVFTLVQYIDQNRNIQRNNVDPAVLIDYFIYQAPENIYYILPISTLMGVMISFGLLSKNSEVTAFKSSGVSIYRLSFPLLAVAVVISLAAFYNQDIIMPSTADDLAQVEAIIENRPVQSLKNPTNRYILSEDQEAIYHFQRFDENEVSISELRIFSFDKEALTMDALYYANQAQWDESAWIAQRGWVVDYQGVRGSQDQLPEGSSLPINETPLYFNQTFRPADQMSYAELENHIDNLQTYGLDTEKENFELNRKLSFPFLPLVMTMLGLPFAFSSARRGGALAGIFISIGMVILYWGMMALFEAMGETGYLPPLLAAWSPNIVFAGLGMLLFSTSRS